MRLATLCTNRQSCCLPLHMAVRLTPAVDSVQVWTCYSCYAIVESVWSCVCEVRYENGPAKVCVKLGESATVTSGKLQRAYGEHSLPRAQVLRWHKSCKLSPSQESENEQIQNQIDAHLFFDSQGIVHKEFVPPGQTVNQTFLSGSPWKTQEKGGTCASRHCTHLDAAPRQRPMSHGSFHQWVFDRRKHSCGFSAPIRRISVPVTSFYSPGSKATWKGAILVLWIISRRA